MVMVEYKSEIKYILNYLLASYVFNDQVLQTEINGYRKNFIYRTKIVSEYDQKIPQSQTAIPF